MNKSIFDKQKVVKMSAVFVENDPCLFVRKK
jgi:hypothetical protein